MNQQKWDLRFLQIAKQVASWSKDPSTKCGAVIVDSSKQRIVATGYNGFPKLVDDAAGRYDNRELKYKFTVHAELNACLQAGEKAQGGTIYVYPAFGSPSLCCECAKAVIQCGIYRVVGLSTDESRKRIERWKDSLAAAQIMVDEAGVEVTIYNEVDVGEIDE